MAKSKKQKPEQPLQDQQDPQDPIDGGAVETDLLPAQDNGHSEPELTPIPEQTEEPAQVQLTIKGSDRSARAAAKRFGGEAQRPPTVVTPPTDTEPPQDNTDELLADGMNMVVVRRQYPKSVQMADGTKRRCAVRLPDSYQCPTTREEIENDVFERFGGKKYKCTIHPSTTNGEQTQLGFFTIEHPDEVEPFFEDAPTASQQDPRDARQEISTSSEDPTMRETDQLVKLRQDAERRIERARLQKEALQMEREAKRLEAELEADRNPGKLTAPVDESDEVKKLREQNAQLAAQLAEKKVNDQFDQIRGTLATLAQAVTALSTKPAPSGESDMMKFLTKKMETDATQINTLMTALTTKSAAPVRSGADELDTFLNRAEKLKAITGSGEGKGSRLSELENRLIDMSFDQLTAGGGGATGGGEGGSEYEDVAKLAVKEFAPILKALVETKMQQEPNGGTVSKEREQQIHVEAAQAVAKKVHDDLLSQGIQLTPGPDGRLIAMQAKAGKVVVPPRHAGTKVVSEQRGAGGLVKKISIEPTNLTPKVTVPAPETQEPGREGGDVKHGVFPMLGEGGATLKIPFPIHPGEMKYDRKFAVDFVLSGIRSEIRQGFPQKAAENKSVESYVAHDAIEFLDDELLDRLEAIDSGPQLEALLTESGGDRAQVDEIKKAGEAEVVASFLRRLIKTIQTEWIKEKAKGGK